MLLVKSALQPGILICYRLPVNLGNSHGWALVVTIVCTYMGNVTCSLLDPSHRVGGSAVSCELGNLWEHRVFGYRKLKSTK